MEHTMHNPHSINNSRSGFKKCLKFLKEFDFFGVYLNFQFKNDEKYKSAIGGASYLLYLICACIYLVINFKNFVDRSEFSLIYNQGNNQTAPPISFKNNSIGIGVGLQIDNRSLYPQLYSLLSVQLTATTMTKINATIMKQTDNITLLPCKYSDFYNLSTKSFDDLGLGYYFCPDLADFYVQGIYTEQVFKYLEFSIKISPDYYNKSEEVEQFFRDNEISAEVYYIDSSIFAYDYSNPIKRFLNSQFTTIDFAFYKKMNIDFSQYTFISDTNILFTSDDTQLLYSVGEVFFYFDYIGKDRLTTHPRDFDKIANLYIRSSPKFIQISRIYYKLGQYLADVSAMLSLILLVMLIIISFINTFKAQQAIIKKIFKFKENLNEKNQDTVKYMKEKFEILKNDINLLDSKYDPNHKKENSLTFGDNRKDITIKKSFLPLIKTNPQNGNEVSFPNNVHTDSPLKELKYSESFVEDRENIQNIQNNQHHQHLQQSEPSPLELDNINNFGQSQDIVTTERVKMNIGTDRRSINFSHHIRNSSNKTFIVVSERKNQTEKKDHSTCKIALDDKSLLKENVIMHFSVWEIVIKFVCFCCPNRKIKSKCQLMNKGYEKLNYNMNVLTYIRKMQEIDILKFILLNKDQITLLNFLSKPSVSLVSNNELIESLYKIFNVEINKSEVDKIGDAINNMFLRDHISDVDKKLLELVNSEIYNLVSD